MISTIIFITTVCVIYSCLNIDNKPLTRFNQVLNILISLLLSALFGSIALIFGIIYYIIEKRN